MHWRTVTALLATPIVAAAIPAVSFLVDPGLPRITWREWIQVGAWVAFAALFEFVVLVPATRMLRRAKFFRASLLGVGVAIWFVISLVWFAAVFTVPIMEVLRAALLTGLAGMAICGTFVVIWMPPAPSGVETANGPDA